MCKYPVGLGANLTLTVIKEILTQRRKERKAGGGKLSENENKAVKTRKAIKPKI
jgi:hypothetical protein